MSLASYEAFSDFYRSNRRKGVRELARQMSFLWKARSAYASFVARKLRVRVSSKPVTEEAIINPGAPSYLFPWGVHEMMKRYEGVPKP